MVDDDNTELITAGSVVTLSVVLVRSCVGEKEIAELGPMVPELQQVCAW